MNASADEEWLRALLFLNQDVLHADDYGDTNKRFGEALGFD